MMNIQITGVGRISYCTRNKFESRYLDSKYIPLGAREPGASERNYGRNRTAAPPRSLLIVSASRREIAQRDTRQRPKLG